MHIYRIYFPRAAQVSFEHLGKDASPIKSLLPPKNAPRTEAKHILNPEHRENKMGHQKEVRWPAVCLFDGALR